MASFDGTDAFFDSREVIERIAALTAEWEEGANYGETEPTQVASDYALSEDDWAAYLGEDGAAEIVALLALQEEAEGYISDWQYGETFYTWDALVEYTEELVNECYTTGELPSWVTNHIDWEAVTEEVKVDYTEFEFRGTTYYAR